MLQEIQKTSVTEIFTDGHERLVQITYVPNTGISAQMGLLDDGCFIPATNDQFTFADGYEDLITLHDGSAWNTDAVTEFIEDYATDANRELAFQDFMKTL